MKPYISSIILGIIWVIILVRCLPIRKNRRKKFEIFAETGIGLFISVIMLGLTSFNNIMLSRAGIIYLQYISILFLIIGIILIVSSFISLKRIGKPTKGLEDTTRLIHKGIFKILRHPLYLGLSMLTIGFLFVYQAFALIIIGLAAVILFYLASRVEDDYNINKFGSSYRKYMKKVPRWNIILGLIRLKNTNL